MDGNDTTTHAHMPTSRTSRIAYLNDELRCHLRGGQLAVTYGILDFHGGVYVPEILERVRAFSDFSADNDPYYERDFGAFDFLGHRINWKIDYYDLDMRYRSTDPADPAITIRLLTVMLAAEY
ncbi:hypothetical protein FG91_03396 [Sphingopyxis sp. LC81]|uniref:DUF3768 domain-containing protein n=1 Tax=Sphingopyxis sp. LC81 TaxID=1502850 RepID=UPI00050DB886|nr:DUF3768 domain-containing protein [Sphingopyxis sp. LC81]KGB52651.1 hypothetical protein FG91_03396 [Sphingopyxis sp. LC81]